ncbi:MAG: carbohydrate kinase [Bacteroidaceae bacterium]|nr:carbohydrate kinase [Bacteroidaceae bacterium]
MYLLGYDIGSSSVKAALVETQTGRIAASAFYPKKEMPIAAPQAGWAEQDPAMWWENLRLATADVLQRTGAKGDDIEAIGISYQMHGLVVVDKARKPLRPSIIWCDSRAVPYGERALKDLGEDYCLGHLLNSPGNFTASKLAWVRENEPELFGKVFRFMLPGDYIALRLTGEMTTTLSGLSEGMLWDFRENSIANELIDYYGIDPTTPCDLVKTFGHQGQVREEAARELGLKVGTPVTYRAGDQPNNALSLGVMNPGEVAATAGTSGVVYGILDTINYDPKSRVNTFAHVNHYPEDPRLGVLLCINGTGCLNSWMHRNVVPNLSYNEMNDLAMQAPIGSEGLCVLPFGNGSERMLENRNPGCSLHGLNFNVHTQAHLLRASQEGIAFAFAYGMEVMQGMGMDIRKIRAGEANLFLSPLFRQAIADTTGATIELCDTDGAAGAARGAGIGAGIYQNADEAMQTLRIVDTIAPRDSEAYRTAYQQWKALL